jgi:hypothetical protein
MNKSEIFTINSVTIRVYLGYSIQLRFLSTLHNLKLNMKKHAIRKCPVTKIFFFYDYAMVDGIQNFMLYLK